MLVSSAPDPAASCTLTQPEQPSRLSESPLFSGLTGLLSETDGRLMDALVLDTSVYSDAGTFIRPHLSPSLSLYYNISVVQRVDLLHLMAPLLPGRSNVTLLAASQTSLSAQPKAHTHAHTHMR